MGLVKRLSVYSYEDTDAQVRKARDGKRMALAVLMTISVSTTVVCLWSWIGGMIADWPMWGRAPVFVAVCFACYLLDFYFVGKLLALGLQGLMATRMSRVFYVNPLIKFSAANMVFVGMCAWLFSAGSSFLGGGIASVTFTDTGADNTQAIERAQNKARSVVAPMRAKVDSIEALIGAETKNRAGKTLWERAQSGKNPHAAGLVDSIRQSVTKSFAAPLEAARAELKEVQTSTRKVLDAELRSLDRKQQAEGAKSETIQGASVWMWRIAGLLPSLMSLGLVLLGATMNVARRMPVPDPDELVISPASGSTGQQRSPDNSPQTQGAGEW